MIIDLNNQIKNSKDNGDKKKLSTKRSKIMGRMNKILEITESHKIEKEHLKVFDTSVREIKPEYAFGMNGRVETLKLIEKIFSGKVEHEIAYFYLLELWVINAEVVMFPHQEYLKELGRRLFGRLNELGSGENYDSLLKVLIKGFYIFFVTQEQQL